MANSTEQDTRNEDDAFEELLEFLKRNRNFDFTGYKRASLQRRIDKRIRDAGLTLGYDEYREYLEQHSEEMARLFDTVLINVTSFFRDDAPWRTLAESVIPRLVEQRRPDSPIRVWSAGCATGEEPYTLAMILAEALGPAVYREQVKIYATDVDDSALAFARHAVYPEKALDDVPPDLRSRYFEKADRGMAVRKEFRRSVIFGRNDLILDAPISRIDLLSCRNTLMYFNSETQDRILSRFHFSLEDGGVLMLGRAETLLAHSAMFTPLDLQQRIFVRAPRPVFGDRRASRAPISDFSTRMIAAPPRLRDMALDAAPIAQLVVDRNGFLTVATERARALFGLVPADIGRPLQDLELSYRPVELRSRIDQAYAEQRAVFIPEVRWHVGDDRWYAISVTPLGGGSGAATGVSISFIDISTGRRLQHELEQANHRLEVSFEELQSTNEEMETTNEELQSTIEELETTNEELQSTNEELETMNEELQSTNAELYAVNDEVSRRSEEIGQLNALLDSVFASLRGAVVVIDEAMQVLVWSRRAEDFWGFRPEEVEGSHFLSLDIGLPVDQLRPLITRVLNDGKAPQSVTIDARNRRGREITCRVTSTQLRAPGAEYPRGVILVFEEVAAT